MAAGGAARAVLRSVANTVDLPRPGPTAPAPGRRTAHTPQWSSSDPASAQSSLRHCSCSAERPVNAPIEKRTV